MQRLFEHTMDWAEVWAIFIPLAVLSKRQQQPAFLRPVIIYLWMALGLNLVGDLIGYFSQYLPEWLHGNNVLYNFHSIIRFICFSNFFHSLNRIFPNMFIKIAGVLAMILLLYNFLFLESFFNPHQLSGNLLATEAYLLLMYCVQYYLIQLKTEESDFLGSKEFWVVTGLAIYVVINFFVFLFYVPLLNQNEDLASQIWTVHNLAYIGLCIFIAKAFYVPARH